MVEGLQKALDYIKNNDSYIVKAIDLQCSVWNGERINMPPETPVLTSILRKPPYGMTM